MTSTAAADLIFGLTRVVGLPALTEAAGAPLPAEDIAQIVTEADRFCTEVLMPGAQAADRAGAVYANGTVTTPYRETYAKWIEGGWQSLAAPAEHGGQGLPASLWTAMIELGFMSNAQDEKLLVSKDWQEKNADSIVRAIAAYFKSQSVQKAGP